MATLNIPNNFPGNGQVEHQNRVKSKQASQQSLEKERAKVQAKRAAEQGPRLVGGEIKSQQKVAANTPASDRAFKIDLTTDLQRRRIDNSQVNGANTAGKSSNINKLAEIRKQSDEFFTKHLKNSSSNNLNSVDQKG